MAQEPSNKAGTKSSRLARDLMLNTLKKLAIDDSDAGLARYVERERARLKEGSEPLFGVEQFEALKQIKRRRPAWQRWLIFSVAAGCSLYGYLALTSPDGLAVRPDGSISGVLNILREKAQGQSFWDHQLVEAQAALKWELAAPERAVERAKRVAEFEQSFARRREELYQRAPELRPSPAMEAAEALREEADRIEAAELDRRMEDIRVERIAKLRQTVGILKKKSI